MASTFDIKGTSLDGFKIGINGPSLNRDGSDIRIGTNKIITEATVPLETVSNIGTGTVGIFKQKTGLNFEFKTLNPSNNQLQISDDPTNNKIDIAVLPGNIPINSLDGILSIVKGGTGANNASSALAALGGASTSTLNSHTSNTSNPHLTTAAQVGAIATSAIGAASGVASLDASTLVPDAQISTNIARTSSPTFTGTVTIPTPTAGDSSTKAASTAFVSNAISSKADSSTVTSSLALKADLASPTFTGTVIIPTPTAGDSSTKAASTAFVGTAISSKADSSAVTSSLALKADLTSPTLTGIPVAPTAAAGTNTTQIATTTFVQGLLASPTFTGDPKAPKPAAFDNDTSVVTSSFVQELCRPGFYAQSVSTQTGTGNFDIVFGNELFDTNGAFSSSTFTVPTGAGGYYLFSGGSYGVNNDASSRVIAVELLVNGSVFTRLCEAYQLPGQGQLRPHASVLISLAAGATVKLNATNFGSGTSHSISTGLSYFWGIRIPM